jgi:hypothetical protein
MAPHGALPFLFPKENHHGSHIGARPIGSPIVVPGQLTLRTIRGKNGPFTVGRLAPIGKFAVKDPELEQYPEGKYDGNSSSATSSRSPIRSATACGSRSVPASTA